jgi:hypothetical protein
MCLVTICEITVYTEKVKNSRRRWEDNIKMGPERRGWDVRCIRQAQVRAH